MGNSGRPARILHITFNMGIGGTEQVIRQIVLGLPRKDFSSQVLCIDGFVGDIGKQLSDENITVTALKRSPGFDWKLVCSIRKILRQSNVDVVHCHQYTPWVYGWLAAIGSGTKVVFTEHGRFHPDRYRYKAVLVNPLIAFTTDAVIAISNATKKAMQKYEFIPASRIKVIYNGIEPLERDESVSKTVRAELGIPADVTVLGTMARLDPVKNQMMMLDAFFEINRNYKDIWLLMVGDGPAGSLLKRRVQELQIGHRVIFTGFKATPFRYLCAMDIFLLSSHTEGTSMTLLEAMSIGIPAVVTSVGGNPEILEDNATGLLTPSDDHHRFAEAIRYLVENPDIANKMGSSANKVFHKNFAVENMLSAYMQTYHAIISNSI